jgi:hypothetical protein
MDVRCNLFLSCGASNRDHVSSFCAGAWCRRGLVDSPDDGCYDIEYHNSQLSCVMMLMSCSPGCHHSLLSIDATDESLPYRRVVCSSCTCIVYLRRNLLIVFQTILALS